ncbi:MAG: hypothetical protein AAF762_10470 [Pseudomonadota bacterium]
MREIFFLFWVVPVVAFADVYKLELIETGQREYYCTATMQLTNTSDELLTEISGFFYAYAGETQVGRSKGTWFMNVAPGETAVGVFETPSAPCGKIDRYDFVVGACRFGSEFADTALCAEKITPVMPVQMAQPGS